MGRTLIRFAWDQSTHSSACSQIQDTQCTLTVRHTFRYQIRNALSDTRYAVHTTACTLPHVPQYPQGTFRHLLPRDRGSGLCSKCLFMNGGGFEFLPRHGAPPSPLVRRRAYRHAPTRRSEHRNGTETASVDLNKWDVMDLGDLNN